MSRFLFRNQGGEPRRVSGRFRTPDGRIINNLNNLSNAELRNLDVFRLVKNIPSVTHRYQRIAFDNYGYDAATATATENYIVQDITKDDAFNLALQDIKSLRLAASAAGFKWRGEKVDQFENVLVGEEKGAVKCDQQSKLNLMMLIEQFRSGATDFQMWELTPQIYIPLRSLEDVMALMQTGAAYEIAQDNREREAVKELKTMYDDPGMTVADMAAKIEDYTVGFETDPDRYVEPII